MIFTNINKFHKFDAYLKLGATGINLRQIGANPRPAGLGQARPAYPCYISSSNFVERHLSLRVSYTKMGSVNFKRKDRKA